ncbi:MAG: TIGR03087 family PEP-CTERM/XrtA system glycosyltransferase [Pseudomonadota bacterium]
MAGKPEALFVCHRIPYPPDKGDKIRSWQLFRRLTDHFDVHLAAFVDDPADWQHEEMLRSMTASLTLGPMRRSLATVRGLKGFLTGQALSIPYYSDKRMWERIREISTRNLAVEVAFSSTAAQYLGLLDTDRNRSFGNRPRIVDLCDADSEKWRAYAREKSFPMSAIYGREAKKLAVVEAQIIEAADAAFAVSAEEARMLQKIAGADASVGWVANGVDTEYFSQTRSSGRAQESDGASIVFTGAMDYWANVEAVQWFAAEIWPTIQREIPSATFTIVGARPTKEVVSLAEQSGIVVTGTVPDVRPYLWGADLAIAPMRIARGVQNKVLEAMASETALVATHAAIEGVALTANDHCAAADDADDFARGVIELLTNHQKRDGFARRGRSFVEEHYRWETCLKRFDDILENAGALST